MRHLALLARAPSAGGKTRLTSGLPEHRARQLREALFLDTLDVARSLGVAVTIFGTPADCLDELQTLAGGIPTMPQADGDLGARMDAACGCLFAQGASRVVLIGSDLPTLPPSHLTAAFAALEVGADVVLGPAEDGGYYLIGMSRQTSAVFENVAWGSATVLHATRSTAAAAGLHTHEIAAWYDMDTPADLVRVTGGPEPATRTRHWMAKLAETEG